MTAMNANFCGWTSRPAVILSGGSPAGTLHGGHYVGSLRDRVARQRDDRQLVTLAAADTLRAADRSAP